MSYKPGWEGGRWSSICDLCGFRFHSDEIKERWDGLKVCKQDWEPRHSLDFIRAKKETITPPWTRPEQIDDFSTVCYMWSRSSYADLAEADCARADVTEQTYTFLLELKNGTASH